MTPIEHIAGQTWHGRKGSVDNNFRYSVDYVLLDAENTGTTPWLFSRNRLNVAALFDKDHGGAPEKGTGVAWVKDVLEAHDIPVNGPIYLLAQPRILGHVFNPVSFWLCHNSNMQLIAMVAEVSNTFGDRHSYLCVKPDRSVITPSDRISAAKIFHVSPFQPVGGEYVFRLDIREDRIGIWIDFSAGENGVMATLTGSRAPLTNRTILSSLFRRPFGSRRVLALIYWQALKLKLKGAPYRTRPEPPLSDVS